MTTSVGKLVTMAPVLLTAMMIAWTAAVYNHSAYGSPLVYPVLAVLPLVLIWHLALIIARKPRTPLVFYAFVHCVILGPVWLLCLTLVSKSSL